MLWPPTKMSATPSEGKLPLSWHVENNLPPQRRTGSVVSPLQLKVVVHSGCTVVFQGNTTVSLNPGSQGAEWVLTVPQLLWPSRNTLDVTYHTMCQFSLKW